jgi:hypothetical protein
MFELKINMMILKKILSSFIVEEKNSIFKSNIDLFRTSNVFSIKNKKNLYLNEKQKIKSRIDWPQGWVSDMSDSSTRSNPRVGQEFLSDGSGRVLAIVRRPNPTREIVRNLRLDKIR